MASIPPPAPAPIPPVTASPGRTPLSLDGSSSVREAASARFVFVIVDSTKFQQGQENLLILDFKKLKKKKLIIKSY